MSDYIYRYDGIKLHDGWQHPVSGVVHTEARWFDSQTAEKLEALGVTRHLKPTIPDHDRYYQRPVEQPSGEYLIEDLPLEQVKAKKRAELNAEKRRRQLAGFEFNGGVFDSHRDAIENITQAAMAARYAIENGIDYTETWTLQDNTTMTLTAEEVLQMQVALTNHGRAMHLQCNQLKDTVDACQSGAEVKAVEWAD